MVELDNSDNSRVEFRKNPDGSLTKVVIKRVVSAKKLILKKKSDEGGVSSEKNSGSPSSEGSSASPGDGSIPGAVTTPKPPPVMGAGYIPKDVMQRQHMDRQSGGYFQSNREGNDPRRRFGPLPPRPGVTRTEYAPRDYPPKDSAGGYPPREGFRSNSYPPRDSQYTPREPGRFGPRTSYPPRDGVRPSSYPPRDGFRPRGPSQQGGGRPPFGGAPRYGSSSFQGPGGNRGYAGGAQGSRSFSGGSSGGGRFSGGGQSGGTDRGGRKIFVERRRPQQGAAPVPEFSSLQGLFDRKDARRFQSKEGDITALQLEKGGHRENFRKFDHQLKRRDLDEYANVPSEVEIPDAISVKLLAHKLNLKVPQLLKKFLSMGAMELTVNDIIDSDTAGIVCAELGCKVKVVSLLEQTKVEPDKGNLEDYKPRPPVVVVMGHVDHGKTSLLDAIRQAKVADQETGGITQHVGAYEVRVPAGTLVMIDTPGHSLFSSMRRRGSEIADVAILVVSGVDGVMPQTVESIRHIKTCKIPVVVAITKADLPDFNMDRILGDLPKYDLVPETWGGDVVVKKVSALKKEGLEDLLNSVVLVAQMAGITGNDKARASGYVLESRMEQGLGSIATVVVKNGTLSKSDLYLCGVLTGKVRAVFNGAGEIIKQATPSSVVQVTGFSGIPRSGDFFQIVEEEKEAKRVVEARQQILRETGSQKVKKISMDNILDAMVNVKIRELKVLIKADVFGSVEAVQEMLLKQKNKEVKVTVVQFSVGPITEGDVSLAVASGAMIIGFRVKTIGKSKKMAEAEGIQISLHETVYSLLDEIQLKLQSLLKKEIQEKELGVAEIKEIFKITGLGKVAGVFVTEGNVVSHCHVRVVREGQVVQLGKVVSLRHYKEEVKQIKSGQECGVQLDYQGALAGDILQFFSVQEIERNLEIDVDVKKEG